MMQTLDDLVCQAESIVTNLEDDDIPHVNRNIEQLRKRGDTFTNRAAQSDIKAAKLLGNKIGHELSATLSKTLESLNVVPSLDSAYPAHIEDIPGFLKTEREIAILSSIDLTRSNSMSASHKFCERVKSDWWKSEKAHILNVLVNSDKLPNLLSIGSQPKYSSDLSGEHSRSTHSTALSKHEIQYSRQFSKHIDCVLGLSADNLSLFDVIIQSDSSPLNANKSSELHEIAKLVLGFSQSANRHSSQFELIANREPDSQLSLDLIDLSLDHLQREYFSFIRQSMGDNSQRDIAEIIARFIERDLCHHSIDQFDDETVLGAPVWPLIFACLRAGLDQIAVRIARDSASNLGEFHVHLATAWSWKSATDGARNNQSGPAAVSLELIRRLSTDYKRHIRASTDPWKRLVYSLLIGVDETDDDQSELVGSPALTTVDDFLWYRLMRVKRGAILSSIINDCSVNNLPSTVGINRNQSISNNRVSLRDLQRAICEEYGETHFRANQQPVTFCRMLILCQLFEPAVAFLARFDHLRCHAVHLALALYDVNLLLVANDHEAPLLSRIDDDSHGLSRLNLIRLVALYTRKFELNNPKEALDLFYALKDIPTSDSSNNINQNFSQNNGFVECVSRLAAESTASLESLFRGSIRGVSGDGARPLLSRYGSVEHQVLEAVARKLQQSGQMEAACELLQMAGQFEEAAASLGELLAGAALSPGNRADSNRLQNRAENLLGQMQPNSDAAITLMSVLGVARFLSQSAALGLSDGFMESQSESVSNSEIALTTLDRTGILPAAPDAGCVRAATERFRRLPELVRTMLPRLLIGAMRTLRVAASFRYNSPESLGDIRRRAAALITFTGQLPYRMPADVYASLSQLELEIN